MSWFLSITKLHISRWGWLALLTVVLAAHNAQAALYAITITDGVSFSVPASLVTFGTINPAPEIDNGVNPIDVAIITDGNVANPLVGVAGALWFGTNTSFCVLVNCTIGASGIDIAFVQVDTVSGQVLITVDGNVFGLPAARLNTFNIYNVTSGVTAQIHNVLGGEVFIQFSSDGQSVSGRIALLGSSGFGGPTPTSQYVADFSGTLIAQ
jgi:hypothetical protein